MDSELLEAELLSPVAGFCAAGWPVTDSWATADSGRPLAAITQTSITAEKKERASQIMEIAGGCENLESVSDTLVLALTFV